jgi:hypothetical protein
MESRQSYTYIKNTIYISKHANAAVDCYALGRQDEGLKHPSAAAKSNEKNSGQ